METQAAPAAAETAPVQGAETGTQQPTAQAQPTAFGAQAQAPVPQQDPGAPAPATDWWTKLPNDLRDAPVFQKYKSEEDAFRGLVEAQKLIGAKQVVQGLVKPADGSPTPELIAYEAMLYKEHLGVPDAPDKYTIDAERYNAEKVAPLAAIAHKANVGDKQFQQMLEGFAEIEMESIEKSKHAAQQTAAENINALQKEWGPGFEQNMQLANSGLDALSEIDGLRELVTSDEVLSMPGHNAIIKAFAKIGEMVKEGGLHQGRTYVPELTPQEYLKQNYDKIVNPAHDAGAAQREYERLLKAAQRG